MNGCRPVYTQGWNDERKLLIKMVEVYKQVQYIQKRGKNKFHGYSYATEADVNEKVREELSSRNVIMLPGVINKELRNTTTKSGNTEYIYRVDMEFNFIDAETGESLVVPMSGEGQDVGDKAIFKAISGCQKYALMKAFMIPTGDDPEGDDGVDERNHKTPQTTVQTPGPSKSSQGLVNHAENLAAIERASETNRASESKDFVSESQSKMLWAKWKSSQYASSKEDCLELISAHLAKNVTDFKFVEKADVNKVIKWLDDHKSAA